MENKDISKTFEKLSSDKSLLRLLILAAAISLAIVIIGIVLDFDLSRRFDRVALGAFGDFVGGLLNPILTFLTFIAVIVTVRLQQTELKETRHEFRRSADALSKENFEATFFRLSSLLRETVAAIDARESAKTVNGVAAISTFVENLKSSYIHGSSEGNIEAAHNDAECITRTNIDHYYRIVILFAEYIDDTLGTKSADLLGTGTDINYSFYARLFRDQLSSAELVAIQCELVRRSDQNLNNLFQRLGFLDITEDWLSMNV